MKRTYLIAVAALCASTMAVQAADKPADGQTQRRPGNPLAAALDSNSDGTIDATEISNAAVALRKLDKNGDGKLTREELRPARPDGQRADGERAERRRKRQQDSQK